MGASRESIGNCKGFLPTFGSPSTSFLPKVHFQCCMLLQGTLGYDFDIFAASGESTAWARSRPIGVRVCPAAQFDFFSTAFDPREWTMVVLWKEDWGRQLRLKTPENEGGDETSSPSPPRFTFFDDSDVPLDPPDTPPALPGPPGPQDSPGPPPGLLPAPQPAGGRERARAEHAPRERSRSRSQSPEPQLKPIQMSDDDDDQSPQDEGQRQRSRSRDRVHRTSATNAAGTTTSTNGYPGACY